MPQFGEDMSGSGSGKPDDQIYQMTEQEYRTILADIRGATLAARTAANAALDASHTCTQMRTELLDHVALQTTEILRLIGSDAATKLRQDSLDHHVQTLVTQANAAIQSASMVAQKSLATQANRASSGLIRRVSIPVGAIATATTLIQTLIQIFIHH